MKKKLIISLVLCFFAGLTVLNISLTQRAENTDTTLDLISVMVKAFDEGEGGGEPRYLEPESFDCEINTSFDANGRIFAFGKWWPIGGTAGANFNLTANIGVNCQTGGNYHCTTTRCIDALALYFGVEGEDPDPS
jgi:hypothetical protein